MLQPLTFFPNKVSNDERGASIIELALIAPVLFLLLFGSIDISRAVAAKLDLEQAAQRTTDFALAQRPRSSDGTYLKDEAAAASGVPAADVAVDIFLECNGVRQADYNSSCVAGETRARLVSVAIRMSFEPVFDWAGLAWFFGGQAIPDPIPITGDSVVRFQ